MTRAYRHAVRGGSITLLGVENGDTIEVLEGFLRALSRSVEGGAVIDGTGPGDAAVAFVFGGNRYFEFSVRGYATEGTLSIPSATKTRAAVSLKLDTGETWSGVGAITVAAKGAVSLRGPSRQVSVEVSGQISSFVEA